MSIKLLPDLDTQKRIADATEEIASKLGSEKVNTSDIVDNLTSTDTNKPLSANQGKVLNDTKADKTYVDAQDQILGAEIIDARDGEVTLGANIAKVKSQLAQKANEVEVYLKRNGININDFDEPTRQTFLEAQGIDVNYVLGEGNVKPLNTSFFSKSSNIFDKSNTVDGYVSIHTGDIITNSIWVTTDFIPIDSTKSYIIRHVRELVYYTVDKSFISGVSENSNNRDNRVLDSIPTTARYMRISWVKSTLSIDAQQVNEGDTLLPYEEYREYIKKENLEKHPLSNQDIPNGLITANKTNFVTLGKNLFDKSTATSGYVVHDGNGTIYAHANYYASDYIEIEPSKEYTQNFGFFSAFYDENKVFISGLGNTSLNPRTFTTPANAKYIRMSSYENRIDSIQLELGSVETVYEPYGYRFIKTIPDTNVANVFSLELTLPPKIYALVGQELNIYFDNIMNDKDIKYDFDVECSIGGQYENYFRVKPTVAGTYQITIKALQDGVQRAVVTSNIIVSSVSAGSGVNKKVLFIGDSTTAGGITTQKLLDNFSTDDMDVTLIGTKGIAPNKTEAISGWTVDKFYTSVDSPFVFSGVFNFTQYITTNGLVTPDYVVINLGINDTFSHASDTSLNTKIATMLTQYQGMIDNIKAYNANIKIGLAITIPPAYGQDSFGKAYGNTYTRWRYKRNNFLWTKALINQFIDKEAQGIYLIPINTNLDTRYNMGLELLPVNSRNTKTFESIVSNGNCHPSAEGYWQIADIFWYWLKSFEV